LSQAQSLPSGGLGVADAMALRKQMKEFQENSLKQLERERSTLKARLIQAEEELRSLQAYMQAEVLAYQKEIARLRTENDQLRGAAPNRSVAATHS
jgi:predicted  nucleic acid-binding Zn-ribbon protein